MNFKAELAELLLCNIYFARLKISSTSEKHLKILDTLVARASRISQIHFFQKKYPVYAFQEMPQKVYV